MIIIKEEPVCLILDWRQKTPRNGKICVLWSRRLGNNCLFSQLIENAIRKFVSGEIRAGSRFQRPVDSTIIFIAEYKILLVSISRASAAGGWAAATRGLRLIALYMSGLYKTGCFDMGLHTLIFLALHVPHPLLGLPQNTILRICPSSPKKSKHRIERGTESRHEAGSVLYRRWGSVLNQSYQTSTLDLFKVDPAEWSDTTIYSSFNLVVP